jgi:hypothetical protein
MLGDDTDYEDAHYAFFSRLLFFLRLRSKYYSLFLSVQTIFICTGLLGLALRITIIIIILRAHLTYVY